MNGYSEAQLKQLRVTLLKPQSPPHGGVSHRAKLVLNGDPAWQEALCSATTWHRLWWQALNNPEGALIDTLEMQRVWIQAVGYTVPDAVLRYEDTIGPVQRVRTELQRIGWTSVSCQQWKDHYGRDLYLADTGPKAMQVLMKQAMRQASRQV